MPTMTMCLRFTTGSTPPMGAGQHLYVRGVLSALVQLWLLCFAVLVLVLRCALPRCRRTCLLRSLERSSLCACLITHVCVWIGRPASSFGTEARCVHEGLPGFACRELCLMSVSDSLVLLPIPQPSPLLVRVCQGETICGTGALDWDWSPKPFW